MTHPKVLKVVAALCLLLLVAGVFCGAAAAIDYSSEQKAPTNIAQALQGAAAGVMVTAQDGAPGAKSAIRIRGIGTINGDAQPLYVVDGVPVGTNADFVNPSDIVSMELLKGAFATAIYGSKGENSEVLMAHKNPKVSSASTGVSLVSSVKKSVSSFINSIFTLITQLFTGFGKQTIMPFIDVPQSTPNLQLESANLAPNLLGPIAVAAYSYMALVPIIQPPI